MGKQGDIPRFRNHQHPVDGLFTAPLHLVHLLPIWTTMGPDAQVDSRCRISAMGGVKTES
jgi:hypothetical protein